MRLARPRRRAAALLAALLAACAGADDGDAGDVDSGAPDDPPPAPRFDGPGAGPVEIGSDRRTPFAFAVSGVLPGLTHLRVDGAPILDLSPAGELAALTSTQLVLRLHGALLAGVHRLRLVTPTAAEPLTSQEIELRVNARPPPVFSASFDPAPFPGPADALFAAGPGPLGLLAAVDAASAPPRLHLRRRAGGALAWEPDGLALDLPGYVHDPAALAPAVTALLRPSPGAPQLRVAWRVALPGAAIAALDLPWGAAPPEPLHLLSAPAPLDEPLEWAAYGPPHLLGDLLLVEMLAAVDSEAPRPGDLRLIALPWSAPALAAQVGGGALTDLDGLGPVLDLAAAAAAAQPRLVLREARARPLLLRAQGAQLSREPLASAAPLGLPTDASLRVAAVRAAFDGLTLLALAPDGAARLLLHDPRAGILAAPLTVAGLPAAEPTGDLAVGVLAGFAVFLIPYGDAAPVHMVISDGTRPVVQPLGDHRCRALALAHELADDADRLPLACLRDGAIYIGALGPA